MKTQMTISGRMKAGLAMASLILFAGCATTNEPLQIQVGKIEQISDVQISSGRQLGVGAVLGAGAGGLLGSLVGGGTGRDLAIVAGAVGGAVAGSTIERNYNDKEPTQQVVVRVESGVLVVVNQQPADRSLRVGQQVFIEGKGNNARIAPRQ
ncbi:glycine zipper 2TM domain-containing protein [Deefgea tanakiae]|uniref:Glycine zipper 2TM domain-containing protein n=1 Tax=Deefgea tanakiae TaxID=2865840 RepID=A0ABX8Z1E3_9NEIS|nr:glycine zipper 2TM domain-containing protein [Deefgea tanakiae]QZA76376.1 glycine zipper 2TM domain-containing protein [Deefgea tanakiae]